MPGSGDHLMNCAVYGASPSRLARNIPSYWKFWTERGGWAAAGCVWLIGSEDKEVHSRFKQEAISGHGAQLPTDLTYCHVFGLGDGELNAIGTRLANARVSFSSGAARVRGRPTTKSV
jgi:hypothetical protein